MLLAGIATAGFIVFRKSETRIGTADFSFLHNGDLILRRGRTVESFAVYTLDRKHNYSHIGIVAYENHIPYIIHVVPDRPGIVMKELPADFLSKKNASQYRILRSDFNTSELERVAGNAFDFYKRKLVFDDRYDLATDRELYCSELILKAFENSNICLSGIRPQKVSLLVGVYYVIMPGVFIENSHFTTVRAG